jgi:hypothetical protein
MRVCDLFDGYRDGELESQEVAAFQNHLAACEDCGLKMSLLNNLVLVLRHEESRPVDLAAQIAREAFSKPGSWSSMVVSWLRPGPAWAVLSLLLIFFSFLYLMPGRRTFDIYAEYENLMDEVESVGLETSAGISQNRGEIEQILWPELEGTSQ